MRWKSFPTIILMTVGLQATSCARAPKETTNESTGTGEGARAAGIVSLGHHAEDLYDQLNVSNWGTADTLLDSLSRDAAAVVAGGAQSGFEAEVSASLARLNQAVAAKDRSTGLVEANRLTELAARLLQPTGPEVPVDVTLLDFFGREIEIRHANNDATGLRAAVDSIYVVWGRVRPSVVDRGGSAEAAGFDSLITGLKAARSREAIAALAAPILEDVDRLEAVFARP